MTTFYTFQTLRLLRTNVLDTVVTLVHISLMFGFLNHSFSTNQIILLARLYNFSLYFPLFLIILDITTLITKLFLYQSRLEHSHCMKRKCFPSYRIFLIQCQLRSPSLIKNDHYISFRLSGIKTGITHCETFKQGTIQVNKESIFDDVQ